MIFCDGVKKLALAKIPETADLCQHSYHLCVSVAFAKIVW